MENFEWVSEEVKKTYNLVNLVYTKAIKFKHPYVLKLKVDPITFNDIFINEKWIHNVSIIACADFATRSFRQMRGESGSLGKDIVQFFMFTLQTIPMDYEIKNKINNKHVSVSLFLNEKEHCE